MFERHDWYDGTGYPKVIQTWLVATLGMMMTPNTKQNLASMLCKGWKDDDDNVDINDLPALAHHAKPELAIEIKEALVTIMLN